MSKFKDSVIAEEAKKVRPAEAVRINGKYIEDEIPGYRTLSVSGRETLNAEVSTRDRTKGSGAFYTSKRYPTRTITVTYQLLAKNNREFRDAFNKLNRILSAEQAQFIFDDEPDKYFIGTRSGGESPQPGRNMVTGSYEILCADPFKYSVTEKPIQMEATGKSYTRKFVFKNDGAIAVPARYELNLFNENGYIGLASDLGAMEFGNRTETDTVAVKVDQPVLTMDKLINGADSGARHGVKRVKCKTEGKVKTNTEWLAIDWGSGSGIHPSSGWCHAFKSWAVPNSTDGAVKDFAMSGRIWFECSNGSQIGEQIIECIGDKNGQQVQIARLAVSKGTTDFAASCYLYVNDQEKGRFAFPPNGQSLFATGERGAFWISKTGKTVSIKVSGAEQHTVTCDVDGFENVRISKVKVYFGHMPYSGQNVARMYFGELRVTAKNVNGQKDQRNTFFPGSSGLKLTIDGTTSKFYYGLTYRPDLEILGSQWFLIPPGEHTVELILSSWFNKKVTGAAYIREAWL